MKNKTQMLSQGSQTKVLGWLYQEEAGDDFLMGKTPKDLPEIWEEEE